MLKPKQQKVSGMGPCIPLANHTGTVRLACRCGEIGLLPCLGRSGGVPCHLPPAASARCFSAAFIAWNAFSVSAISPPWNGIRRPDKYSSFTNRQPALPSAGGSMRR